MTAIDLRTFAEPTIPRLSRRVQSILAVTTIVTLAAVARFGLIAWPFWNDSGLYIALGRSIARGDVMYRDFYETKLPGVGMLMSAAWRAFGPCWPACVIAQFAMTLLAAGAISRAVGRHLGRAAALPCFLYAVAHLNFDYAVFTGFQLETIQALFECLAAASAIESLAAGQYDIKGPGPFMSAFTAGLAAGVAAMVKPGGASVALALVVCLMFVRRWKPVTAVVVGFAMPTAATVWFTVGTGAWPYLPGVVADIHRYTAGTPMRWDDLLKVVVLLLGLAMPFALTIGSLTAQAERPGIGRSSAVRSDVARVSNPWSSLRQPQPKDHGLKTRATMLCFATGWFLLDLTAAVAQHRMYLYYFLPLAGPAAILFGIAGRRISPIRMTVGLLPIALLSLTWQACDPAHWSRGIQPSALSTYIAAHTAPADRVYMDPPGRLAIETDRDPGVSAGVLFSWVNDDTAPQRFCDRMIADLDTWQTKYVILATTWDVPVPQMADGDILTRNPARRTEFIRNWGRFRAYLHAHYTVETTIDGQQIYRRKS